DAVGLADLVADQTAEDVLRVVAERGVTAEDRGDVRALGLLQDAEDAGVLRLLFGELLGEVRIRVVLRTLQAVQTLLVLGGLLAHLAFFALVALALAALLIVLLGLQPLGDVFFLLLRRLDQELHEAVVAVEQIQRQRLRVRCDRDAHGPHKAQGGRRTDRVDLLVPAPGQERHVQRARARRRGHHERGLAAVEPRRGALRQREAGAALLDELLQLVALVVDEHLAGHARGDVDDVVGAGRRHQRVRRRWDIFRGYRRVDVAVRTDQEVRAGLAAALEAHVRQDDAGEQATEDDRGAAARAILPGEALRVLARGLPLLVADLLGADVHRGDDEQTQRHHGGAETGVHHRRALTVRALPFRAEQVAGAGGDAAEDGLNLHRARTIVNLDLGARARRARERRRRERLLGRRRVSRRRCLVRLLGRGRVRHGRRRVAGRSGGLTAAAPRLRRRGRLRRHRVAEGDDHAAVAEHDLVTRLETGLGDALAVDRRSARRPEVDDVNVVR